MLATRKQIRDSVLDTTQQLDAQIGNLVEDYINVTLQEIGSPAWAFRNEKYHLWSWLKRKRTFTASSEDTVLERDVDKIALLRQTDSPTKITYMSDEEFYAILPNPTESGNPRVYRLWEVIGTSAKLGSADNLSVVSDSTLDTSDYSVVISGYVSGRLQSESFTMNGTTTVTGNISFDAREIFISKSALFNGNVTVKDTAATPNTLVIIGKEEISPRFKVVSLWPAPSSSTIYMEYYKKIKELNDDNESPEFDSKWHHIVRIGTLAKVYQHLGKVNDFQITQDQYMRAVRSMVSDDECLPDSIFYLRKRDNLMKAGVRLHLSEDIIT